MSKSYFELNLNDREDLQDEKIYELNRLRQRSHCKTINESSAADMAAMLDLAAYWCPKVASSFHDLTSLRLI